MIFSEINIKNYYILLLTAILSLLFSNTLSAKQNRIALVIGNGSYKQIPLKNPVNDAHAISENLKKLGFKVILKTDASQQNMDDAIDQFGQALENGGVGLFFYAGHGIQSNGRNYLIPIDAKLKKEKDLKYHAVDSGKILDEMKNANNGLNIVILDACRNNPLTRSFRSASRGLARIDDIPTGTLLAYSTAPGRVAADGDGANSPYTEQLISAMNQKGTPLEMVFKNVAKGVLKQTRGQQVPWISSSITGDFYFTEGQAELTRQSTSNAPNNVTEQQHEDRFWASVVARNTKEMYKAYLSEYPSGRYIDKAKNKLNPSAEKLETLSLTELTQRAKQGEAPAQYNLGLVYEKGYGVKADYGQSFQWYKKSALQGFPLAQFKLGVMYRSGIEVKKNAKEAVKWWKKAAKQGDKQAQYALAVSLSKGLGVTKNNTRAFEWYKKSARQSFLPAQYGLGHIYQTGYGTKKDLTKAFYWYKKSAEKGYGESFYSLGYAYLFGDGVNKNTKKAIKWFLKASAVSNRHTALAEYQLAGIYSSGDGVSVDYKKAAKWYQKAADKGDEYSITRLGELYLKGKGVAQNYDKGIYWLKLAAKKGDEVAIKKLKQLDEMF